jgi:2-polyprenyl-3-methyl-5-hydroxy-6-metoxy-1,4-benzoquinol methylase
MVSLESFRSTYNPDIVAVDVGGRTFDIFVPSRIDDFINPLNPLQAFPLWAKIWPAAHVLAGLLAKTAPERGRRMIEVGGGLGLVSVAAASAGHRITLSESDPVALEFARATALLNGLADLPVIRLDWNSDPGPERFDVIVGSELVYRREDIQPLVSLFSRLLADGGHILLAGERRRAMGEFLSRGAPLFAVDRIPAAPAPDACDGRDIQVLRLERSV